VTSLAGPTGVRRHGLLRKLARGLRLHNELDLAGAARLDCHLTLSAAAGNQAKDGLSKDALEAALKKVPFKLGGGKTQLSLFEVVPNYAVQVHARLSVRFGARDCRDRVSH